MHRVISSISGAAPTMKICSVNMDPVYPQLIPSGVNNSWNAGMSAGTKRNQESTVEGSAKHGLGTYLPYGPRGDDDELN